MEGIISKERGCWTVVWSLVHRDNEAAAFLRSSMCIIRDLQLHQCRGPHALIPEQRIPFGLIHVPQNSRKPVPWLDSVPEVGQELFGGETFPLGADSTAGSDVPSMQHGIGLGKQRERILIQEAVSV